MKTMSSNVRAAPKGYREKKHVRWRMRLAAAVVSVAGLLGLWQFVANEAPAAPATPTFRDVEQQLQLGNTNLQGQQGQQGQFNFQGAPAPNTSSGSS